MIVQIRRSVFDEYAETYDPTIEDRYKKSLIYKGKPAHLEILDTAGKVRSDIAFRAASLSTETVTV